VLVYVLKPSHNSCYPLLMLNITVQYFVLLVDQVELNRLRDTNSAFVATDLNPSLKNCETGNVHRGKHFWRFEITIVATERQQ
jgi:hypothetical protein